MKTSRRTARVALVWGRGRIKAFARMRRAQLLVAVLFGAVIGGGFAAVASTGLGHDAHDHRPGFSTVADPSGRTDHSGYDMDRP